MAYTTINKSTDYFNTITYTGNGSTNAKTGVGFQPDWLWIKCRSDANGGVLFDALRSTNSITSSDSSAQADRASDGFTSLDSDGFTMNGSGSGGNLNVNGRTYVAWNWKAGGGQGSSNTDGSINTTYTSVNTTAGFSISSYTGTGSNATVGHGLGVAPKMIIFKNTNSTRDWGVYHAGMNDPDAYLTLNQNYVKETSYNFSNNTAPTNSVFSVGTLNSNNGSSQEYIAYCFAEKAGYSRFGSYTGNGNADGTFVYTGFKPAFVIRKRTDTTADWRMDDNKRPGYNVIPHTLFPNLSNAETESTHYKTDFLSNGFKCYGTSGNQNASGGTYIYMAFGQSIVGTNNIPATAQ